MVYNVETVGFIPYNKQPVQNSGQLPQVTPKEINWQGWDKILLTPPTSGKVLSSATSSTGIHAESSLLTYTWYKPQLSPSLYLTPLATVPV